MILFLLPILASFSVASTSDDSLVAALSKLDPPALTKIVSEPGDFRKALAQLLLAGSDTTLKVDEANVALDKIYQSGPTPMRAALLGTSESIRARESRDNKFEAAKWIGKSMAHLDEAVAGAPSDLTIRVFRINALVKVPEMFHVEMGLNEDAELLKDHIGGKVSSAPSADLLALASVSWRFARSKEAIAYWKIVASRTSTDRQMAKTAKRNLEKYNP